MVLHVVRICSNPRSSWIFGSTEGRWSSYLRMETQVFRKKSFRKLIASNAKCMHNTSLNSFWDDLSWIRENYVREYLISAFMLWTDQQCKHLSYVYAGGFPKCITESTGRQEVACWLDSHPSKLSSSSLVSKRRSFNVTVSLLVLELLNPLLASLQVCMKSSMTVTFSMWMLRCSFIWHVDTSTYGLGSYPWEQPCASCSSLCSFPGS